MTHPSIIGTGVVLRPTTEEDLEMLVGWFNRPDVLRFWEQYEVDTTRAVAIAVVLDQGRRDGAAFPSRRFDVVPPDRHRFDADHDGIGCEAADD